MTKDKPKIAFCFSWQARTFDCTYKYFKKNLFDAAKEQWYDYDIFCAVEDDEDAEKVYVMNPRSVEKIKSNEVKKIIDEKYWNFIKKSFNKKYYFFRFWKYSIINWLQQFYKIYRANELKNQYSTNYDIVVRLRFDVIFLNKIDFKRINDRVINSIILNFWPSPIDSINDQIAFWNTSNMNVYSSVFTEFDKIFNKEIRWTKHKIINYFDNLLNFFDKIVYMQFSRFKIVNSILWYFFWKKAYYLWKNGFFIYNYEKVLHEHIKNHNIYIYNWEFCFILYKGGMNNNIFGINGWEFEI